jgi:hypothetical protein
MIGYKIVLSINACRLLLTLEIPSDAKTNMNRPDIFDKDKASYRCNKCNVINIEDELGNIYTEAFSIFDSDFKYELNKQVEVKNFDENGGSAGIHFYLSKIVAYNQDVRVKWYIKDGKTMIDCVLPPILENNALIRYNANGSMYQKIPFSFSKNSIKVTGDLVYYKNNVVETVYKYKNNVLIE